MPLNHLIIKLKEDVDLSILEHKKINQYFIKDRYIGTNASDIFEYLKKKLKGYDFEILVFDPLKVTKYPRLEQNEDYIVAPSQWEGSWYSRLKKLEKIKKPPEQISCNRWDKEIMYTDDQLEQLMLKDQWIYRANVKGAYVYGPKYLELEQEFKEAYKKVILKDQIYEPTRFLPIITIEDLIKTNYLYTCMPNLYYIFQIAPTDLKIKYYIEGKVDSKELLSMAKGCNYVLNYCACQGFWPAMKNKNFKKEMLYLDDSTVTYRNEHGRTKSLERLEVFNRMELVFLGNLKIIEQLKERILYFFQLLDLPINLTKEQSWFLSTNDQGPFTYDFNTKVDGKTLELGNISYNGSYWTKPYNVKMNNHLVESGCSGLGIQRNIWAGLKYHGFKFLDILKNINKK